MPNLKGLAPWLLIGCFLVGGIGGGVSAEGPTVGDPIRIRHASIEVVVHPLGLRETGCRFEVSGLGPFGRYEHFVLTDPDRLVIDLAERTVPRSKTVTVADESCVKSVRFGVREVGSRVVFDLSSAPVRYDVSERDRSSISIRVLGAASDRSVGDAEESKPSGGEVVAVPAETPEANLSEAAREGDNLEGDKITAPVLSKPTSYEPVSTPTLAPLPSHTPTLTPSPVPTATATPTSTPPPTPTHTHTPTATLTPTAPPEPQAEPSPLKTSGNETKVGSSSEAKIYSRPVTVDGFSAGGLIGEGMFPETGGWLDGQGGGVDGLQVDRVIVEFKPGERPVHNFLVMNGSDGVVRVVISLTELDPLQGESESDGIIASPLTFAVAAGEKRLVRLVAQEMGGESERIFRVRLAGARQVEGDSVPEIEERSVYVLQAPSNSVVQMSTRWEHDRLFVTNEGTRVIGVHDLQLCDGGVPTVCRGVRGGFLFPRRTLILDVGSGGRAEFTKRIGSDSQRVVLEAER